MHTDKMHIVGITYNLEQRLAFYELLICTVRTVPLIKAPLC